MNATDIWVLSPYIALLATATLVMLAIAVRRNYATNLVLTVAGLVTALYFTFQVAGSVPRDVTALIIVDSFSLFFAGLLTITALVVVLLGHTYFAKREQYPDEFHLLIVLATLGAAVMPASKHFISFYLGLEVLSVSLYALIAYTRENHRSTEAAVKYLVIAAAATAFLLFGMALVYAALGTLDLAIIGGAVSAKVFEPLLLTGMALFLVGVGFKLSLAPFHMWTPDVYEGAPAPVTAFIATASKAGMLGALLRYFSLGETHALFVPFAAMAIASMLVGNLLALRQQNIKRLLACSSIAHVGYMLIALIAGGRAAALGVTLYLVAYFVTTLGAFGAITLASRRNLDEDLADIDDYRGLLRRDPLIGTVLILMMLSLAGIPLTAGFIGKFIVLSIGLMSAQWWMLATLLVSSAIGLFYYLRVVYIVSAAPKTAPGDLCVSSGTCMGEKMGIAVLCALALLLVALGAYPMPWIQLIGGIQ